MVACSFADLPDSCMLRLVGMRCCSPVEQASLPYQTDPSSLPPSDAARLDKVKMNKERWVWLIINGRSFDKWKELWVWLLISRCGC